MLESAFLSPVGDTGVFFYFVPFCLFCAQVRNTEFIPPSDHDTLRSSVDPSLLSCFIFFNPKALLHSSICTHSDIFDRCLEICMDPYM